MLHGWQGAKELRPALPYPQVQWLRRTCLAARTLAVALTLTLVAVVFLGAFLALALVVACLAFNEVGAALSARGFLASSSATRRVGAERARLETRGTVAGCAIGRVGEF